MPALSATAANADWTQFQGGPAHTGTTTEGPRPPYTQAWSYQEPGSDRGLSAPIVADGVAIAVGVHGVFGVDLATGKQRWSLFRNGGPLAPPAVGGAAGHTYLAFTDQAGSVTSLVCVDLSRSPMKEIWRQELGSTSRSGVTIDGERVFVGDDAGDVYGFDLVTGRPLWPPVGGIGRVEAPPAAGGGDIFVVTRDPTNGAVAAFSIDEASGSEGVPVQPRAAGSPSAAAFGGRSAYVLFPDQQVHALGPGGVVDVPSMRTLAFVVFVSAPAISGGSLYVADITGGVYRFDLATGDRAWDFQLNTLEFRGSPVVVNDDVLLGLNDGRVVALDASRGHQVWQRDTGPGAAGAIAVFGDTVVVQTLGSQGGLVAFRSSPGPLTDIVSPTVLRAGRTVGNFAVALLATFVAVFVPVRLLSRRLDLPPLGSGGDLDEEWRGLDEDEPDHDEDE